MKNITSNKMIKLYCFSAYGGNNPGTKVGTPFQFEKYLDFETLKLKSTN